MMTQRRTVTEKILFTIATGKPKNFLKCLNGNFLHLIFRYSYLHDGSKNTVKLNIVTT